MAIDRERDPRTDLALARRAALGDRPAFAEIFHRYGSGLYRYALRMLDGDSGDAEDAVQESFTNAWLHIGDFRGESSLKTWLYQVTANNVLSSRRRRRPVATDDWMLEPESTHAAPTTESAFASQELWAALDEALAELPWRQRASWLLREMEGLSYNEIATILGTSPTVVRGQLHRARASLAIRLEQWR